MATNDLSTYLKYANLQMAAEALYRIPTTSSSAIGSTPASYSGLTVEALIKGNDHASKFTEVLAADFVTQYEIVAHQPNTSTGFSGTLFRAIKDDPATGTHVGDLVMSFRSTEFIDDALRDSTGTNKGIASFGWAFGQIADMEDWYRSLIDSGTLTASTPFDVTGYSLGGHLATAFGILRQEAGSSVIKHIYTFNGAGTGSIGQETNLTELIQRFRAIWQDGLEPQGYPASLLETLRVAARNDVSNFLAESARVHSLVPGDGGGPNTSPEGVFVSENFWFAMRFAALQTTGGAFVAGNDPTSPNYADSRFMLNGLMTELAGSGIGMVSTSGLRHSQDRVVIQIEDQPAIRGLPTSIPDLTNNWTLNDFADTHSLVLIVDSLSVMNALATLDPSLTLNTAASIFKGASTAVKDTGGQGQAEGDVLENVLDALVHTFTHTDPRLRYGETQSGYDLNTGNTWADETLRKNFYDQLAALQQSQAFKDLAGKFTIGLPETGTLSNSARTDFSSLLTLLTLSPFTLKPVDGAKSLVEEKLRAAWPSEYEAWRADQSLTSAQLANGEGNYTSLFIHDRARFLGWLTQANTQNKTTISDGGPDQWVAEERNYQGASEFLPLSLDINSGLFGTTGDAQRLIFGKDSAGDNLVGGQKDDHLYGMGGNDTLTGGNGADHLEGNADNDSLSGGEGSDSLFGGMGDDTLEGGKEGDTLYGGKGSDTYVFTRGDGWDWIDDSDGQGRITYGGTVLDGGEYVAPNVWQKKDGDGKVLFTYILSDWTEHGETFQRLSIQGEDGGMWVKNWRPGDLGITLPGAPAPVDRPVTDTTPTGETLTVDGRSGTFTAYLVDLAKNNAVENTGTPLFIRTHSHYDSQGNSSTDALNRGNNNIIGGSAADIIDLSVSSGNNLVVGGGGQDIIAASGNGNNRFFANQEMAIAAALAFGKTGEATGQTGSVLAVGNGNSTLVGGNGDDVLLAGTGDNLIICGPGKNIVITGVVTAEIFDHYNTGHWGLSGDGSAPPTTVLPGIDINGSGGTAPAGYEGNLPYSINTVSGQSPRVWPQQIPGGGNNLIYGGKGDNVFILGNGSNTVYLGSGHSDAYGGTGRDYLIGGAGNSQILGNGGDDYLEGQGGTDSLWGGGGDDSLYGGTGADNLAGDGAFASATASAQGRDYLDGGDDNDTLLGGGNADTLFGGSGNDHLHGDGSDTPETLQGNDALDGGSGNDQLTGYGGNDTLQGGADNDSLWGSAGNDSLDGGSGADYLDGGADNDVLQGGTGNDTLWGGSGSGNDTLAGGAGADYLAGEGGDDTYLFNTGDSVSVSGMTDAIDDNEGNNRVILSGVSSTGIGVLRNGNYLVLTYGSEQLLIKGGFAGAIRSYTFADGRSLEWTALVNRYFAGSLTQNSATAGSQLAGGSQADSLTGTAGGHQFHGGQGDDTLTGSGGNNTYHYAPGDGNDRINDTSAKIDAQGNAAPNTVEFGVGITPAQLQLASDGWNLQIRIGNTGDALQIANFNPDDPLAAPAIDRFAFANGTVLSLAELLALGFDGTDAGNQLIGTNQSERIDGHGGNDNINGGAGDDTLIGGSGDDVLDGRDGTNTLIGGTGDDTYWYNGTDSIVENADEGWDTVVLSTDTSVVLSLSDLAFENIEEVDLRIAPEAFWVSDSTIVGSVANDTIFVSSGEFTSISLEGGDGNDSLQTQKNDQNSSSMNWARDTLFGGAGDDRLVSNMGADYLNGGTGADYMAGGRGSDTYIVDNVGDIVVEVSDTFYSSDVLDQVKSTVSYVLPEYVEDFYLIGEAALDGYGNEADNRIFGTSSANQLEGRGGNDQIFGFGGDDWLDGGAGNDILSGGDGTNTAAYVSSTSGVTVSLMSYVAQDTGGSGVDTLVGIQNLEGSAFNDVLIGSSRNNTLDGGDGNDLLDGGDGIDTVSYASSSSRVEVNLSIVTAQDTQGAGIDTLSSLENLFGSNFDDLLAGNDGNNLLDGAAGADTLVGGNGEDTYFVDNTNDLVVETNASTTGGYDLVNATVSYVLGDNIETLNLQGADSISGTGNEISNRILGNAVQNRLEGLGGNDQLDGGLGADTLIGGAGSDLYWVDDQGDAVIEVDATETGGVDEVLSIVDYTLGVNVENLSLTGIASINGTGNTLNNELRGNSGANVLDGGSGDDQMWGRAGNDLYVVDSVEDQVFEVVDEGADTIASAVTYSLFLAANVENLRLIGDAAIDGFGNDLDNIITGNSADNVLEGGWGDDLLDGGAGNDTYEFYMCSGNDIISSSDVALGKRDVVQLWTSPSSAFLTKAGEDLVLSFVEGPGTLTIRDWFKQSAPTKIEEIRFMVADPPVSWTAEAIDLAFQNNSAGVDNLIGGVNGDIMIGLGGNDVLAGNSGDDYLSGDEGDDELYGNDDNDNLFGGDGNDLLEGGAGDDVLRGGAGDDLLLSGDGWDYLDGGAGNDVLFSDTGNCDMEGGSGTDTYRIVAGCGFVGISAWRADASVPASTDTIEFLEGINPDAVIVRREYDDLLLELSPMGDVVSYYGYFAADTSSRDILGGVRFADGTIWDQQKLIELSICTFGTAESDTLAGDESANKIYGLGGNDFLSGLGGDDLLDGGIGADIMSGGQGNDTFIVDSVNDVVSENSNEGVDLVQSSVTYVLGSNLENLTLNGTAYINGTGNSLGNALAGNNVDNVLNGGAGVDVLAGLDGNDSYVVDNVGDSIIESVGQGTDLVQASVTYTLAANVENLTLTGASAITGTGNTLDNVLIGNSAINTLTGGAGNDTLDGDVGADNLLGGTGNDTYIVDNTGDVITENANEGTDLVKSSVTYTLASNVENLTLTGTAAINGTGNAADNILTGNSAANTLTGGAGNDTYYVSTGDTVTDAASAGTDTVVSDVAWTLGSNLEKLTLTGTAAINGTGNTLANVLSGNAGNNTLSGGTGADTLIGGVGNDTYVVDNTGDVVSENLNEGTDLVQSGVTYTLSANVENLTLTGTTAINGTGNAQDNLLTGNSGANTLTGGAGNDTLNGGTGADKLIGGLGDDTYSVDNTSDVVTENANEGFDVVNSTITLTLAANAEALFLSGSSAINGTGNTANNLLRGNTAVNTLNGGTGNDILEGGAGNDILTDTSGTALFNGGAGTDTMTGGSAAEIYLGGLGNDTYTTAGGNDIILFNKGDGQDTFTTGGTGSDTVSLGGGVGYADLSFSKATNDLVLKIGSTDKITFKNWYATTPSKPVVNLQVIAEAMADFAAGGADPLRDQKVENFNFAGLVGAFDAARAANASLTSWALTNALTSFQLAGSDSAALGGDLAYQYGKNGTLAGIGVTPALDTLASAALGSSAQILTPLAGLQVGSTRLS